MGWEGDQVAGRATVDRREALWGRGPDCACAIEKHWLVGAIVGGDWR
jgi:hypothetical protein